MNNQDYGFSQVDSDFHINVPKGNNVPAAFQSEDGMGINFTRSTYEMGAGSYYEGMARGPDGSHLVQDAQSVPTKAGLGCAVYNIGVNEDSAGYASSSGQAQVPGGQQYCSPYLNVNVENASALPFANCIQPPPETEFLRNVSQSQQCVDQFQHQDFQPHSNVFHNRVSSNDKAESNALEPSTNIFPPGGTEFMECNPTPQILYPPANANPIETTTSVYSAGNEPTLIPSSFAESPLHCMNEYTQFETPLLSEKCHAISATNVLQRGNSQAPSSENVMRNNGESNNYSGVSETIGCDKTSVSNLTSVTESLLTTPQKLSESYLGLGDPDLSSTLNNRISVQSPREDCRLDSGSQSKVCNEQSTVDHMLNVAEAEEDSAGTLVTPEKESEFGLPVGQETEHKDEFTVQSMSEVTALEGEGKTEEGKSSAPQEEHCSTKELSASVETLDDLADKLEEGIASTSENITMDEGSSAKGRPLSPMITDMDTTLGEGQETDISMSTEAVGAVEHPKDHDKDNVRITRSGTGSLRNRTQRFIEEYDDSDDSSHGFINAEDREYEEGAELAPCTVDSSITVPQNVLTVTPDEEDYYKRKFSNGVNSVLKMRLHCTSCNRHIGAAPNYIHLGNRHKVLRVLICNRCCSFYGVGKFPKDSDGSELYCRWCGQGGQVICCSTCPNVFCKPCIRRNLGPAQLDIISNLDDWACFLCNYKVLWELRSICWAVLTYTRQKKTDAISSSDAKKMLDLEEDNSKCCNTKNHKRKKSHVKSKASASYINTSQKTPVPREDDSFNTFEFGHFLFQNQNFLEAVEIGEIGEMGGDVSKAVGTAGPTSAEEDDFIDPSQFVQPVLEEQQPPKSSGPALQRRLCQAMHTITAPAPQGQPHSVRPKTLQRTIHTAPQQTILRAPQQIVHRLPHRAVQRTSHPATFRATSPRIVIRQGNLMQPGLVPINNQPNSISPPTLRAPVSHPASSGSHARNPPHFLNNVEGVRSLDQMQSLDKVPWFRDAIDGIRATGFALSKRIRDLEARFHSLKNKQDVEKVMILGKKLQRLNTKTMLRYQQMHLNLQDACKRWYIKKLGANSAKAQKVDPLSLYSDCPSDWDDDRELSKPLEKVMIPVNSAALQRGVVRPSVRPTVSVNNPPPLIRTGTPLSVLGPRVTVATIGPRPSSLIRLPSVKTALSSDVTVTYSRQPLPGPKSGAVRYRQIPSSQLNASLLKRGNPLGVGTFLNERNGLNSVSVTLAPSAKRKRVESFSSDGSDVVVCPTIPDLLEMHNIKPCKVMLYRNDSFIESFLEKQHQKRCLESFVSTSLEMSNGVDSIPRMDNLSSDLLSNNGVEILDGISEREESVIQDTLTVGVSALHTAPEEDDDIEIIDEVRPLNTISCDNN